MRLYLPNRPTDWLTLLCFRGQLNLHTLRLRDWSKIIIYHLRESIDHDRNTQKPSLITANGNTHVEI